MKTGLFLGVLGVLCVCSALLFAQKPVTTLYGLEQVEIVEHQVLLPYPTEVQLDITSPSRDAPDRDTAARLDDVLMKTERAFLDAAGIPGRPWYRHLLFAPKPTYAPEVQPGVAEALAAGDRSGLDAQVARLARALDRAATTLSNMGNVPRSF